MHEQTYIVKAIESLRNELLAPDDGPKESIDGILGHLKTLNGGTRSQNAITRLNLIVFGLAVLSLLRSLVLSQAVAEGVEIPTGSDA